MCGIAGLLHFDGKPADPSIVDRMAGTLRHRGPDDTGKYICGPVGLGHRRLSIIDAAGGRQPMTSADGGLSITFNGEIFNFLELREELCKKGHRFRTRSDTEVILALYQEHGPDCVTRMNGQWAFAIWDGRNRRLFLSRDRLGMLPLYYATVGHTFLFGSEIKALFAYPGTNRELDLHALRQVFTYWFPVSPRTIIRGISELAPGHSAVVENRRIDIRPYWKIDFSEGDSVKSVDATAERRYLDELQYLLLDATRLRLRADVPVGAYLSGGLDSTITSALAHQYVGQSLSTFSVAFDDPALDESRFQADVVGKLGTVHHTIRCSSAQIAGEFPEVIRHTERPILRTAPVPMFLLSKLVRENGFKVVLTGEGSDEFLGGYDIYKEAKIRAFWAAQIDSKFRPLLLKRLYPYLPGFQQQPVGYLRKFFHVSPEDVTNPLFSHIPRWQLTARTHALFSPAIRREFGGGDHQEDMTSLLPPSFSTWTPLSRAQYLESAFLLPGYLLSSQGDRVAMAHSVEARYPFLDHRVIEFSMRMPPQLRMKVLNEKYLLKRAFAGLVPASVLERPKQPYRAPDAVSFFDSATGQARHSYVEECLSAERIRANGVFDTGAVQRLLERVRAGKAADFVSNAALVGVLSTQLLIDRFISHSPAESDEPDKARGTPVCG